MKDIIIDNFSRAVLIYLVVADIVGFIISVLILLTTFHNPKLVNANNLPTLNGILAGAVFALSVISVEAININATENRTPFLLCQISGVFTLASGSVIIVTVAFSAAYRYFVIVLEYRPLSIREMVYALGAIWITFSLLWLIPALGPRDLIEPFEVSHFGGACNPNFTSRKPFNMAAAIATIIGILGTPINVGIVYVTIWRKLAKAKHAVSSMFTGTTHIESHIDPHLKIKALTTEQIIIRHAILNVTLYALLWTPKAIMWAIECATGQVLPHYIVAIAHIFMTTHLYVSPLLTLYLDRSLRTALLSFIGLDAYTTKENSFSRSTPIIREKVVEDDEGIMGNKSSNRLLSKQIVSNTT